MLKKWLDQVSAEVNRPPKNARFSVRDGDITLDAPAEIGFQTDTDTLIATAQAAIQQGVTGLYLPAEVREPILHGGEYARMGLRQHHCGGHLIVCRFTA